MSSAASIPETVAILEDWNGWVGDKLIGHNNVGGTGFVDIDVENEGSWLRKIIDQFIPYAKLHGVYLICEGESDQTPSEASDSLSINGTQLDYCTQSETAWLADWQMRQ
jgi:hypothetical protein